MRTVQIETLTPIHVGSGVELQSSFEYLHFKDENCLVIIDDAKVLDILGEENLPHWLACIEKKESLLKLLQTRKPNIKADDVATRRIPLSNKGIAEGKTVREQSRLVAPPSRSGPWFLQSPFGDPIAEALVDRLFG